jgi:hypothetical protein
MKPGHIAPLLAAVTTLLAGPAAGACEDPFVWEEPGARIEVALVWGRGFITIEATDQIAESGREASRGRLYSHFRTDAARLASGKFWEPGSASLSLAAPAVSLSRDNRLENRIFFDGRRVVRDRDPGLEFFGVAGRDGHAEVWTYRRDDIEGPTGGGWMLDNLQRHGEVRIEHWSARDRGPLVKKTEASFEWSRIDRLVDRARVHFAGCPAA